MECKPTKKILDILVISTKEQYIAFIHILLMQESLYPSTTSFDKSGLSETESVSYYRDSHVYEVNHQEPLIDDYRRPPENSSRISDQTVTASTEWAEGENPTLVLS